MTSAKIILDSKHPTIAGSRVTTMEITFHRFVLAEFNTHRAISKNSASSRAIPLKKQLQRVRENCALPVSWPAEQKGMQGGAELNAIAQQRAQDLWLASRDIAADVAEKLGEETDLHKSLCNRLLEPYMWHTAIITATEWDNFFDLRCNALAQPEIRVLAEAMLDALSFSVPQDLPGHGWHLPFVTNYDDDQLRAEYPDTMGDVARACSAARCARVSYLTHDTGKRDVQKDLDRFNSLINPGEGPLHASPLEHTCTPAEDGVAVLGNFKHWAQLRHLVTGEA